MHHLASHWKPGEADVLVMGGGPAGLSVAVALAERGVKTVCVAPDLEQPWPNNYGLWLDDVAGVELSPGAGLDVPMARQWGSVRVIPDDDGEVLLPRAYGQVDRPAFKADLLSRFAEAGGQVHVGYVSDLAFDARGVGVSIQGGGCVFARVVIDASGAKSPFTIRPDGAPTAFQVAWGCLFEVDALPRSLDTMLLMDWRAPSASPEAYDAPSFLYAMPYDSHHVFVQETSLVARPPLELGQLEDRLNSRMRSMGLCIRSQGFVERCVIPMDLSVPQRPQTVLPFGASAGFIHPATGYSVARSLRAASSVADALAQALDDGGGGPQAAVAKGWQSLWPPEAMRARELLEMGSELVVSMNRAQLGGFFRAFFKAPAKLHQAYLSGEASSAQLVAAMLAMLPHLSWALRGKALAHGLRAVARAGGRQSAREALNAANT